MTPERWRLTEELYHAARARPPDERAAFLAGACPDDDALRHDVESLLNELASDDGFLARPALLTPAPWIAEPTPMTGRTLGGYRLEALLGAGGMGEVYRARDAKLGRDVAIKILPRAFTSDSDRLARFDREARTLATLNHPNICAIHGLEERDGVRFLILEFVEGETLAHRLGVRGRGLPLGEALAIARQIADALEVAHEKGIVHRDLKPANINITSGGVVKVLDFGLAKAIGPADAGPDGAAITDTRDGAVLGTAAYMSPEQARGLAVDKRTDIWAFGCVLYEMLTGRVAFPGDTVSDSIAKVLEREPDWSALPVATPAPVRRLMLRALAKDPKKRVRDIGDVRIEIDAIDEVLPGALAPVPAKPRAPWLPWVALVAVAAGAGVLEIRRAAATGDTPLANATYTPFTNWKGSEGSAEISPDGNYVAFLADRDGEFDLWWSQVGTGDFNNLTRDLPPLNAHGILRSLGFSGNGADLWFAPGAGERKMIMPQAGGIRRSFLVEGASGPAYSRDGRLVYFDRLKDDARYVTDRNIMDAHPIEITPSDPKDWSGVGDTVVHNHNPVWAPDGEWIYFVHGFVHGLNQADEMDVWRVRPSGGSPERLTRLNTAVTFLAPLDVRTLLYVARAADGSGPWLWALDVASKVSSRATSGLEQYTSVSASHDGRRLVVTKANPTASLWTMPVPIPDSVVEERDVQPYQLQTDRALAPRFGGPSSLFYLSSRGTSDGLWRFEDEKSAEILKGADGPLFEPPAPSPDGRRVAVILRREGKHRLAILSADGTDMRTLAPAIDARGTPDWSPDGAWIVIGGTDGQGMALFKIPVDGGGAPVRLVDREAVNPVWSPTDNLIVYSGPLSNAQVTLYGVRPDRTPVDLKPVRVAPGAYRFLRDGTGLVFVPNYRSLDFWLFDLASGKTRRLTQLGNQGSLRTFDLTPDGTHIVFDRSRDNADIVLIDRAK